MDIRKIGVVGAFAAGAMFALAPLASADASDPLFGIDNVLQSEVASMNFIFETDAYLAGVSPEDITLGHPTVADPLSFDTVLPKDAPVVTDVEDLTPLDYSLYGMEPIKAGIADDPGSYNVFNGALAEFYDAFNVELYSMLNDGALIPEADLFGSPDTIAAALGTAADPNTVIEAVDTFYAAGLVDFSSFFPA